MLYQQGDVLIETVNEIPEQATVIQPAQRGIILAEGEVTGHAHVMNPVSATLLTDGMDRFLRVSSKTAVVEHEEHHNITIPKGDYKIRIVKEYDHFAEEARNVQD